MVTLDRQARALEAAFAYRDHHSQTGQSGWPLCVALSGQVGTPAEAVAEEVGRGLGWPVHDDDILESVAEDLGIHVATLESFGERRRSWLLECLEALSSRPSVGEYVYVRRLVRQLRAFAAEGHCVIVGRGSAQVLPGESTFRVRLIGTRDDRREGLVQRSGLSRERALTMLDELEAERAAFIQEHFHHDPREVDDYDLIVNTSHLHPAECAALIIEGVRQREMLTEEARI